MTEETSKDPTVVPSGITMRGLSEIQSSLTQDGKIPEGLILGFHSNDPQTRKLAVTIIRKILQIPGPHAIQPVIDTGLVPALVALLDSEDTYLQLLTAPKSEATWIVTNIASGTTAQTGRVVEAGAIPKLVRLSESPSDYASLNAIWALRNIVGDSPSLRDRVEDAGGIDALQIHLDEATTDVDKESIACAIQSLSRILDRGLKRSEFIETGVVPRLVHLVANSSSSASIQKRALKCIGYLVNGDDHDTDAAVDAGLVPALLVPVEATDEELCKLALWNASNIAAGSQSQVYALLNCGLLTPTVRILINEQCSPRCRREACWTVSNLAAKVSGDVKVGQAFLEGGCVEGLAAGILIPDRKAKEIAVLGITKILEWQDSESPGSEVGVSLSAAIQSSSWPQNLRVTRDSCELRDRLRKDCQTLLTRWFPEYKIPAYLTADEKIPKALLRAFYSNDLQIRCIAVTKIRTIQAVQPVIDALLVPSLVSLLDSEDAGLQ
ncbi:Importin subunit alpha-3, partial [Tulasnella sp. UAMH 9824]